MLGPFMDIRRQNYKKKQPPDWGSLREKSILLQYDVRCAMCAIKYILYHSLNYSFKLAGSICTVRYLLWQMCQFTAIPFVLRVYCVCAVSRNSAQVICFSKKFRGCIRILHTRYRSMLSRKRNSGLLRNKNVGNHSFRSKRLSNNSVYVVIDG